MDDKLYIKKFIRDDGKTLSFDAEEIYLASENTLLVRTDPSTTAIEFTEADGGEMIRQRGAIYTQPINGLIVPHTTTYWELCAELSQFFRFNHTYKIIYVKIDGSMFAVNNAWISTGLQIVPVPHEDYSQWSIEFSIGNTAWTDYAENEQGEQIYSNTVTLPLLTANAGGEIWEYSQSPSVEVQGINIEINGTTSQDTVSDLRMDGNTAQQTYAGKNMEPGGYVTATSLGVKHVWDNVYVTLSGTTTGSYSDISPSINTAISPGTYTFSTDKTSTFKKVARIRYGGANHDATINANETSVTFTIPDDVSDAVVYRYFISGISSGLSISDTFGLMLETGSTPSAFEPYVGGIPSPSPDYPQTVNVVTGTQMVKMHGKNLWGGYTAYSRDINGILFNTNSDGSITAIGTASAAAFSATGQVAYSNGTYINLPAGTYYLSTKDNLPSGVFIHVVTTTNSSIIRDGAGSFTISSDTNVAVRLRVDNGTAIPGGITVYPMIEKSPTMTTYQAYTSQSYAINLSSTELCKLGTYQDYIYKSGNDWFIHKDIGKLVLKGTENGWSYNGSNNVFSINLGELFPLQTTTVPFSNNFIGQTTSSFGQALDKHISLQSNSTAASQRILIKYTDLAQQAQAIRDWLGTHNTTLYYPLETATDTQITDASLIEDLEALLGQVLYDGKTILTVTGSLPGPLKLTIQKAPISGEKWDTVGGEWEAGSGGVQTIDIQSTQAVYPVWVVEGPCDNPIIVNNTTDTGAQFNGTVAAGQTLTVDFEEGTAYLNSALATRYVSGYLSLEPGENTVGFNSDGGNTQSCTISWDNVVN